MVKDVHDNLSNMCEVECMCFSETALAITSAIKPEVKSKKQCNLWLNHTDLSAIYVSKSKDRPIVCKDGWALT